MLLTGLLKVMAGVWLFSFADCDIKFWFWEMLFLADWRWPVVLSDYTIESSVSLALALAVEARGGFCWSITCCSVFLLITFFSGTNIVFYLISLRLLSPALLWGPFKFSKELFLAKLVLTLFLAVFTFSIFSSLWISSLTDILYAILLFLLLLTLNSLSNFAFPIASLFSSFSLSLCAFLASCCVLANIYIWSLVDLAFMSSRSFWTSLRISLSWSYGYKVFCTISSLRTLSAFL